MARRIATSLIATSNKKIPDEQKCNGIKAMPEH